MVLDYLIIHFPNSWSLNLQEVKGDHLYLPSIQVTSFEPLISCKHFKSWHTNDYLLSGNTDFQFSQPCTRTFFAQKQAWVLDTRTFAQKHAWVLTWSVIWWVILQGAAAGWQQVWRENMSWVETWTNWWRNRGEYTRWGRLCGEEGGRKGRGERRKGKEKSRKLW